MFTHIVRWMLKWVPYVLAAVSNLVLVLLGIVMSLPKLAEKIEDNL